MAAAKEVIMVRVRGTGERTAKEMLLELLRKKRENLTYGEKRSII